MFSFSMTVETALVFWERVIERQANTEEERIEILLEMVEEGLIQNVSYTNRTKEEYVEDLSKEFNVLDFTGEELEEKQDERLN